MLKKKTYLLHLIQISCLVLICAVAIYKIAMLHHTANELKFQQIEKFAASLSGFAAEEAQHYLAKNKTQDLHLLIDNLSKDTAIQDATIYNNLGEIIYQSKPILGLSDLLKITPNNKVDSSEITPYISELYSDNKKIGYIRITLKKHEILKLIDEYQDQSTSTILLMMFILFFTGVILTLVLSSKYNISYPYLKEALKEAVKKEAFIKLINLIKHKKP